MDRLGKSAVQFIDKEAAYIDSSLFHSKIIGFNNTLKQTL